MRKHITKLLLALMCLVISLPAFGQIGVGGGGETWPYTWTLHEYTTTTPEGETVTCNVGEYLATLIADSNTSLTASGNTHAGRSHNSGWAKVTWASITPYDSPYNSLTVEYRIRNLTSLTYSHTLVAADFESFLYVGAYAGEIVETWSRTIGSSFSDPSVDSETSVSFSEPRFMTVPYQTALWFKVAYVTIRTDNIGAFSEQDILEPIDIRWWSPFYWGSYFGIGVAFSGSQAQSSIVIDEVTPN